MAFRYDTPTNPFAGTIGEIILRRGDIAAQQAQAVAAAQARATELSGLAWANTANQIGQTAAGVIQQATDPQRKLLAMKVAEQQQLARGQQGLDRMMAGDQLPAGDVGPRQESYLRPDGLYDIPKLNQGLSAMGVGHLAPDLLKHAEDLNASIATAQQHDQQAAQSKAIMLGYMASGALKLHQSVGMPLDGAIDFVAQPGLAAKQIQPQELAGFKAQISQLPPEQQVGALQQIMDHAAELAPKKTLAKDALETDIFGRTTASNAAPDKAEKATFGLRMPDGSVKNVEGSFLPSANGGKGAYSYLGQDVSANVVKSEEPKAPHSLDEQLFEAISKGDKATATKITDTMRAAAQAKGDPAAIAATNRQIATITAQIAQQSRAQNFAEAQAGRKELTEKVEQPYQTAIGSANTLRDVVAAAQAGNKVAGSLQALETTMAAIRAQGLNRINTAEIGSTADAGSLWDRIVGRVGKLTKGEPVPADLQKDMTEFAGILEKAAYQKYAEAHKSVTTRYKLTDESPLPPPGAPAKGTTRNGATWDLRNGQWGWWK